MLFAVLEGKPGFFAVAKGVKNFNFYIAMRFYMIYNRRIKGADMNKLMTVCADKGSIVINGICFPLNGSDGTFDVVFTDKRPSDVQEQAWIDLRDCPLVAIWESDCNPDSGHTFTAQDFDNAMAIGLGFKKKTQKFCIWKQF